MNIRLATHNDTASLTFLRGERGVLLQQSDPRLTASSSVLPTDDFAAMLDQPECRLIVGDLDGRVAGYAVGMVRQYAGQVLPASTGLVAELTLDAHKYYGGLGRALLHDLHAWFQTQGIDRVMVRVARYHAVEQAFWRSLGASETPDTLFDISPALVWMRLV